MQNQKTENEKNNIVLRDMKVTKTNIIINIEEMIQNNLKENIKESKDNIILVKFDK